MANITNRDFYLFLNSYGDWKKAADGYGLGSAQGDGVVNKGEFGKFVKTEWDQGGNGTQTWNGETSDLSADLINKFWALFDTDCISDAGFNQLDDDELNKMKLGMDAYNLVNTLTAELTAPTGFNQQDWLNEVKVHLTTTVDKYIETHDTINIEDLTGILKTELPNAQFEATKSMIVNTVLETYKNYASLDCYDLRNDNTLMPVIDAYVNSLTLNTAPKDTNEIVNEIKKIINAYINTASTTIVNGDNPYAAKFAQEDGDELNGLQAHKAKNYLTDVVITNGVKTESDYASKQSAYDNAAENYIKNTLANANVGQYATIMATTWAGVKDEVLKEVKLQEKLEALFNTEGIKGLKFDLENELQKKLQPKFTNNEEKAVEVYLQVYDDCLGEIKDNLEDYTTENGDLDIDEIATYVENKIREKMTSSSSGKADSIDENADLSQITDYEGLKNYSNAYFDDKNILELNKNFENTKAKAIDIVIKLIGLNNEQFKTAVATALGVTDTSLNRSKIEESFNECTTASEINKKLDAIWAECDKNKITLNNWNEVNIPILETGENHQVQLSANITNSAGNIISDNVTYQITNSNSTNGTTATIDGLGILNIQAGSTTGQATITVAAIVNGNVIGKTTITVKVGVNTDNIIGSVKDWGGSKSEHLETYNVDKGRANQLTDSDFKYLYDQDAIIRLDLEWDNDQDWNGAKATVFSRLDQLGNCIFTALKTTGALAETTLDLAIKNVVQRYKDNANGAYNKNNDGTHKSDLMDNNVNYMNKNRDTTGHRIWGTFDKDHANSSTWTVRFKDLVDDIIAEYNSLICS